MVTYIKLWKALKKESRKSNNELLDCFKILGQSWSALFPFFKRAFLEELKLSTSSLVIRAVDLKTAV